MSQVLLYPVNYFRLIITKTCRQNGKTLPDGMVDEMFDSMKKEKLKEINKSSMGLLDLFRFLFQNKTSLFSSLSFFCLSCFLFIRSSHYFNLIFLYINAGWVQVPNRERQITKSESSESPPMLRGMVTNVREWYG